MYRAGHTQTEHVAGQRATDAHRGGRWLCTRAAREEPREPLSRGVVILTLCFVSILPTATSTAPFPCETQPDIRLRLVTSQGPPRPSPPPGPPARLGHRLRYLLVCLQTASLAAFLQAFFGSQRCSYSQFHRGRSSHNATAKHRYRTQHVLRIHTR